MKQKQVYVLEGRNGYSGPWTFMQWFASKRSAEDARMRQRFAFTEVRVVKEWEYLAKERAARVPRD